VTGVLLPLVLVAVLSVVAVRAARSGTPSRPPGRVRVPRRALAAAGIAAATAAGLVALGGQGATPGVAAARPCSAATSATRCR
jgi:hypothetical protein